jgi:hypothetical protein
MAAEIFPGITDDNDFIELLNSLVRGLLVKQAPDQLWIIQIDNWFDHKWLRYSGKGIVDFRWPAFMNKYDAALSEFYQDKLTFPPFAPNRVLGQWSFVRVDDHYSEAPLHVLPHPSEKRRSETNLHRRVESLSHSACFIWYSARTLSNSKANVMAYNISGDRVEAWFAAFNRQDCWKLQATRGANRDQIQQLLNAT